jgi:uncharacterized membrane protein YraQ (UPF0718 family)
VRAGHVYLIIAFGLLLISYLKGKQRTKEAIKATIKILYTILPVLIFVFVLMGLIQAYVSRETIAAILGKETGVMGILYAELVGSVALFLPPAVFPFGGYFHDNGAAYGPIAGFVFTAILIGVTTLPLEFKLPGKRLTIARNTFTFAIAFSWLLSWGWPFALLRLSLVVLFALIVGFLMNRVGDEPS